MGNSRRRGAAARKKPLYSFFKILKTKEATEKSAIVIDSPTRNLLAEFLSN